MNKSGITRRIDELGRIVIPKEIRSNLGIRDCEPLEIFVDNNSIIIKKFSQIINIKEISLKICDIMSEVCNINLLITDREKVIVSSKKLKKYDNSILDDKLKDLIDNRESYISKNKDNYFDMNKYFIILPIITSTDCSGLVILVSEDNNTENLIYAKIVQKLLVDKLEI